MVSSSRQKESESLVGEYGKTQCQHLDQFDFAKRYANQGTGVLLRQMTAQPRFITALVTGLLSVVLFGLPGKASGKCFLVENQFVARGIVGCVSHFGLAIHTARSKFVIANRD